MSLDREALRQHARKTAAETRRRQGLTPTLTDEYSLDRLAAILSKGGAADVA